MDDNKPLCYVIHPVYWVTRMSGSHGGAVNLRVKGGESCYNIIWFRIRLSRNLIPALLYGIIRTKQENQPFRELDVLYQYTNIYNDTGISL